VCPVTAVLRKASEIFNFWWLPLKRKREGGGGKRKNKHN